MNKSSMIKAALIGGLIIAVPTLLPIIGLGCCLWALAGGAVATWFCVNGATQPLVSKDGAKAGALAGFVAAVLHFIVRAPMLIYTFPEMLEIMSTNSRVPIDQQVAFAQLKDNPPMIIILSMVISLLVSIILLGLAVLGGMLGVSLFEKRKPGAGPGPSSWPPPQYPQASDYSGGSATRYPQAYNPAPPPPQHNPQHNPPPTPDEPETRE